MRSSPKERPLEAKSRERILDNAAHLFRHGGYGATSLRDVAAACDMKAGSLYYHFASKDEIVTEILNIGVKRVQEAVQKSVGSLSDHAAPSSAIEAAIRAHLVALHQAGDYTSANVRIFNQVPDSVRNLHIPVRRSYEKFWVKLLRRAQKTGDLSRSADAKLTCAILLSSLNATLEWFDPTRGSVSRLATAFSNLLLHR